MILRKKANKGSGEESKTRFGLPFRDKGERDVSANGKKCGCRKIS